MKKCTLDDLWKKKLNNTHNLESSLPLDYYTQPLNKLFQEARSRENRWRNGVIMVVSCLVGNGLLFYGINCRTTRDQEVKDQQICIQSAEQQQFSPVLCSGDCFRESYFELQREYKIDDLDLAYRIATNKCGEK